MPEGGKKTHKKYAAGVSGARRHRKKVVDAPKRKSRSKSHSKKSKSRSHSRKSHSHGKK